MNSGKLYTRGNKDDIQQAVKSLDEFTHNFCMNCAETERQNDLIFRCAECPMQIDEKCILKQFKNKFAPEYKNFGCMGDL